MPFDAQLAERLRTGLPGSEVREVAMFGGRSFMVCDRLAVCASSEGSLLVRCAPEDAERLAEGAGVCPAEMRGRPMSAGWLRVSLDAVADEASLQGWIEIAVAFARRSE